MKSTLKCTRHNEKETIDFVQENERELVIVHRHPHMSMYRMNIMKSYIEQTLNYYRFNISILIKKLFFSNNKNELRNESEKEIMTKMIM